MLRHTLVITTMSKLKSNTKKIARDIVLISGINDFGFKVKDNLAEGMKAVLLNTERAVYNSFTKNFNARAPRNKKEAAQIASFGRQVASGTADRSPIDSGKLRESVGHESTGYATGQVFMEKNYAVHVEFGTKFMPPRPVFRLGVADAEDDNARILEAELNKGIV